MEKIMLAYIALLVLNTLAAPFLKHKKGVLFCGLFGFSGDEKPNLAKLKILGIKNEKRGVDSCGVYYNNVLAKGVNGTKVFSDFIQSTDVMDADVTPDQNIFIGHTRWATVGAHTADNAHPFLLQDNHIFAHNGTIENIDDLLKKYGVDKFAEKLQVDSQGLGYLFIQNGRSILEEYRGYAAFLYHDRTERNTMWIFKGASKKWDTQYAQVMEERPLFYVQHREGIYFSSIEETLKMIQDGPGQIPKAVPENMLIKVVGSNFGVEQYQVLRENNNIGIDLKKPTVVYPQRATTTPIHSHTPVKNLMSSTPVKVASGTNSTVGRVLNIHKNFSVAEKVALDINNEAYPPKCFDKKYSESDIDFVFWWRGRYYHGDDILCDGIMYLDKDGFIADGPLAGFYENFFYRGVMIESKKLYDSLMFEITTQTPTGLKIIGNHSNFAKAIAPYSRYPVTNMISDSVNVHPDEIKFLNTWFMRDTRNKKHFVYTSANHSFTPLYGKDRNYVFKNGDLISIQCANKGDKPMLVQRNELIISADTDITEGIIINNPKTSEVDTHNMIIDDAKIRALTGFFRRKYVDIDEFKAEVPSTVLAALGYYVEDFLLLTEGEYSVGRGLNYVDGFIRNAIADKISLEENMVEMQGILTVYEYVKAAIMAENTENEDKKKEASFDVSSMNRTLNDEDDLVKIMRMARTFVNLFKKKSSVLKESTIPISQRLAPEFDSCAELVQSTFIEFLEDSNYKGATTDSKKLIEILK